MKLNEIMKIPSQPANMIEKDFEDLQQYKSAKVEHMPLLYKQVGDRYLFQINERDGLPAARMVLEHLTDPELADKISLRIIRTWVRPSLRNKGYMTAMYRTLVTQENRLISDAALTPESIAIWKKLGINRLLNPKTKKFRKFKSMEQAIEDVTDPTKVKLLLVLEGNGIPRGFLGHINQDNFFMEEYNIFINSDNP